MELTVLYRPVGQREYELIAGSEFRRFPPRLPEQPFFYPVTNAEYATQIARDWNTKDEASGRIGYVLRFRISSEFLRRYPVRTVGTVVHQEYWIPAADLEAFNDYIDGQIETTACFRAAMKTAYRLSDDVEHIGRVQSATTTTEEFGIEPTHGLFGSPDWWNRIASRELPLQTANGVITQVYMGSMGDWPEFAMRSDSGEELRWTREVNSKEQDALYRVGRRVEVDYVIQRHRPKSWDRGAETKCVIEIRVNDDEP
jgi:hypothetical protein